MTPVDWITLYASLAVLVAVGAYYGYHFAERCRNKRWHLTLHAVQDRLIASETEPLTALDPFTAKAVFDVVTVHQMLPVRLVIGMKLPCQEADHT